MPVNGVPVRGDAVLGGKLRAGLEERLEDRVGLLEVVVDDVHEAVRIHDAVDELARRRLRLVELGPLPAEFERLVLQDGRENVSEMLWNAG